MLQEASVAQWVLGILLVLAALGVIALRKPIYASLSFLMTLLLLATLYSELSAEFIAVMQILVYAGAILVVFVFVMVLFQDAHEKIALLKSESRLPLLIFATAAFGLVFLFFGAQLTSFKALPPMAPEEFGTVQSLGQAMYVDFFFPFEAVILLFLAAIVGAFYMAKKET